MNLIKHNTELAGRIKLLDIPADDQLAKELMELHQAKCTKCQEDRLSCTVRPSCKNRNFLNLLIELGVEPHDLPAFCYSQYLDQLRRFILDRKGRGMLDRRLLIKDLLSTLKVSSIRHFNSKFKEQWENYHRVSGDNQMIVYGNDLLFHFDFSRGIVIINPKDMDITNFEVLKLYAEILSNIYNVKGEAKDLTANWWVVHAEVSQKLTAAKINSIEQKISDNFDDILVDTTKDSTTFEAEIIKQGRKPPIDVGKLREFFETMNQLKDEDNEE